MKKTITVVILCLLALGMQAQTSFFDLGLHGGWNNTKINVKNLKSSAHSGYTLGAFARINIRKIYIEPSLDWVHKEVPVEGNGVDGKLKSNSLDIPVMLGTKLLRLPILNLRVFAGPNFSFLLDDMKITDINNETLKASDTMWYLRFGAGVDVWKFTLDLNHEFGMKKFSDNIKKPTTWNVILGFKLL